MNSRCTQSELCKSGKRKHRLFADRSHALSTSLRPRAGWVKVSQLVISYPVYDRGKSNCIPCLGQRGQKPVPCPPVRPRIAQIRKYQPPPPPLLHGYFRKETKNSDLSPGFIGGGGRGRGRFSFQPTSQPTVIRKRAKGNRTFSAGDFISLL